LFEKLHIFDMALEARSWRFVRDSEFVYQNVNLFLEG